MRRAVVFLSLMCFWLNACQTELASVPSPKLSSELSTTIVTIPRAAFTEDIGERSVSFMAHPMILTESLKAGSSGLLCAAMQNPRSLHFIHALKTMMPSAIFAKALR